MKIGFIGLGTMGRHMASNLIRAGHALVVHDVRREAAAPHRDAGAGWADTPRAVAEATDVVFTSLPGPPEVEAVALGEQGLLAGLKAGKVYFDLTTNAPALVRRIHATFTVHGIHMLDAPVSGGPRGAETRRLARWGGAAAPPRRRAGVALPEGRVRAARVRVAAGAAGRHPRGEPRPRAPGAHAAREYHARGADRGAHPGLGRARLAGRDAATGRARGRRDPRPRRRDPSGARARVMCACGVRATSSAAA